MVLCRRKSPASGAGSAEIGYIRSRRVESAKERSEFLDLEVFHRKDDAARMQRTVISNLAELTLPLPRNHVERLSSKFPAFQYVSETYDHKPNASGRYDGSRQAAREG